MRPVDRPKAILEPREVICIVLDYQRHRGKCSSKRMYDGLICKLLLARPRASFIITMMIRARLRTGVKIKCTWAVRDTDKLILLNLEISTVNDQQPTNATHAVEEPHAPRKPVLTR